MQIPTNIYGLELLRWVCQTPELTNEGIAIREAIKHLCFPNLQSFGLQRFTDEECLIYKRLELSNSNNIEIAARANDILRVSLKDKREVTKLASDLYMQVFDKTNKFDYLLRSIQVRCIKDICSDEYFERAIARISQLNPHAFQLCVSSFHKSYANNLYKLKPLLNSKYANYIELYNFGDARATIDSLLFIKAISHYEADYRRAVLYENEADYNEANCKENTFLMQTHSQYKSAFQLINRVKEQYPKDFIRIKQKLIRANQEFADILQVIGVRKKYAILDEVERFIKEECEYKTITNIYEAVGWLLTIPFISEDQVNDGMQKIRKNGMLSSMMNVSRSDAKGNTIGNANADDGLKVEIHRHFRMNTYFAIYRYLQTIIQQQIDTSEEKWLEYLFAGRPKYVSDDVVCLMAKGFSYALDGDMIVAVHLLVPSLEALLRQKAESIHGSLKKYENDRNDEATLDNILRHLENDFDNHEEWFELKSFLTVGIDENYRNQLMHGVMPMKHIYNQGIYLFWLCLKMYFKDWNIKESESI